MKPASKIQGDCLDKAPHSATGQFVEHVKHIAELPPFVESHAGVTRALVGRHLIADTPERIIDNFADNKGRISLLSTTLTIIAPAFLRRNEKKEL